MINDLQPGDLCQFTKEAKRRSSFLYRERRGVFLKYNQNGLAVIVWDGNKSASCYHRSFIEGAADQQQITLSEPTPEQEAYLRKIEEASSRHDPSTIIGGRE